MFAIHIDPTKHLHWTKTAKPSLGAGEVLIRVVATAVNRADLAQREGFYPPPPGASEILGLECSGHIEAVGNGVTQWQVGDAVCALLAGGGCAEYVVVDARHCLPVPAGISVQDAAALPEVFATAYLNLYREAHLKIGERVLLPAAASGVGTAAIQLCKYFGNPVFVSVGSQEKLDFCLSLGAESGIVRGKGDLSAVVGKAGINVILDPVGGSALPEQMALLKTGGRVVLIAFMAGRKANIDLGILLVKRLKLMGSTLRSRSADEKADLIAAMRENVWPGFISGDLKPVIDRVYPIEEIEQAHAHVELNRNIGKVLLRIA